MDLPLEEHRVHDRADIVDHVVADDIDHAGLAVDLHLDHVTAIGIVLFGRRIDRLRRQSGFHARRQAGGIGRRLCDLDNRHLAVGPGDREHALAEFDIVHRRFHQVRGDLARLVDNLVGRHQQRRAADGRRAGAAGTLPERHDIRVALAVMHIVEGKAQPVADKLLEHGFMPLAVIGRPRQDRRRAGAVEPDLAAFEPGGGGPFDGVGYADPAQLAARRDLPAACLEPGVIRHAERHVHVLLERAAIVFEGQPGLERHRVRRDRVAAAELHRIDAELVGGNIHQPLDHEGGFGPSRPAIGPGNGGMGEHGGDIHMDRGRRVHARKRAEIDRQRPARRLGDIGADIADGLHPHAEELPVLVERQFADSDVIAPLSIRLESLGPVGCPFHRAARHLRGPQHQHVLVID